MSNPLPSKFYSYFWDTDPQKIDIKEKSFYITERLLEFGDAECLHWLEKTYGVDYLKEVVATSRSLSKKSANFYSIYYHINPGKVLCLQKDFQLKHKTIWQS